jgi:hypothetical protein
MPPVKAKPKLFLAEYKSDDAYLVGPDQTHGRPGLLPARDPMGRDVLVKVWPRIEGANQDDLEQIWRSEIRQGSPLEIFRRTKNPPPSLAQPRLPRNRRRLWQTLYAQRKHWSFCIPRG